MALVVITGGARSGKSRAAEQLAASRALAGMPVTVAVFGSESDAEMTDRIGHHRAHRPEGFATLSAEDSLSWLAEVPADALLVVDCLGTCVGRAMLEVWNARAAAGAATGAAAGGDMTDAAELPAGFEAAFVAKLSAIVSAIAERPGDTIVVTNEVGDGVVPAFATGRIFRDELGRANRALIDIADAAYFAVGGRLIDLTGAPRNIHWPAD